MTSALRNVWQTSPLRCISIEAIVAVAVVTAASLLARRLQISSSPFTAPFVFACAVLANKRGLCAGLTAAVASMGAFNFFLSSAGPPYEFNVPTTFEAIAYVLMVAVSFLVAKGEIAAEEPAATGDERGAVDLPFTANEHNEDGTLKRVFWDVRASGSWAEDCAVGSQYGRIYLHALGLAKRPLLCWIVRDMMHAGTYSGVETGFLQALDQRLNAARPSQQS